MSLSADQKEILSSMTEKQRMKCIIDVSANLEVVQATMRSLNAYRTDILDDGMANDILEMRSKLEQRLWEFKDKMDALMNIDKVPSKSKDKGIALKQFHRDTLIDIMENHESADKITVSCNDQTNTVTVELYDLDEQWMTEMSGVNLPKDN